MAGIGFELRKVVRKGDPFSYLRMAVSGAMIVAGPWLVTVAAVGIVQLFADALPGAGGELFVATLVYVYAGSLVIFGGSHYLYSRIVSDLLYERKEGDCFAYLVLFSAAVGLVSALIGGFVAHAVPLSGFEHPGAYRLSSSLLFILVSVHWVFLLHLSLLKWYGRIFTVYALGMAVSAAAAIPLSARLGPGGMVLGFAAGQAFILAAVFGLIVRAYPSPALPAVLRTAPGVVLGYLRRNLPLVLTGGSYYLAIWTDKFAFWAIRGSRVKGTPFLLSPEYDRIIYFANLAMIPGLVYFVVFSETEFYIQLRRFLENLSKKRLLVLLEMKGKVFRAANEAVSGLALFQASLTVCLLLLVPLAADRGFLPHGPVPYLLLSAVFFHLLFFALMSFLFFVESFEYALFGALVFLVLNLSLSFISGAAGLPSGLSYLASAAGACLFDAAALRVSIGNLDRRIFARSTEEG